MYRNLRFRTLDQVVEELKIIKTSAVLNSIATWSPYQNIKHLSELMNYSLTKYPMEMPIFLRLTVGKIYKKYMFTLGYMPQGLPNPIAPKVREEGDTRKEIDLFLLRIQEFKNFKGEFAIHPIFDKLSREDWEILHSMHAAHHLSNISY